jgi:hypothetical protein
MPVILEKADEVDWLNPDNVEPERLLPLLKSYPAGKMEEWHVGEEARSPRNDYPEIIEKLNHHESIWCIRTSLPGHPTEAPSRHSAAKGFRAS